MVKRMGKLTFRRQEKLLSNLKQVATLQDRYFKPEGSHVHDHNYIQLIYPNLVQEQEHT